MWSQFDHKHFELNVSITFSKAEAEASEILQKARAELKAEAGKARQNLRADVDRFSDEIVIKLVKV